MEKFIQLIAFPVFIFSLTYFLTIRAEASPPEDRGPLSKITFIHYKKGSRPDNPTARVEKVKPNLDQQAKPVKPPKTSSCYSYIASGAKWKSLEYVYFNPTNSNDLDNIYLKSALDSSIAEWESHANYDIFGPTHLATDTQFSYIPDVVDNLNVIDFGPLENDSIIGVTTIWGYFGGRPNTREIVEFDIRLNDSYTWGDGELNDSKMDVQNILTHELGHGAGMGDIYDSTCTEETMYGYSYYGDIIKRTLNPGDIMGISKLY